MNIAIILGAGNGTRMRDISTAPKQFIMMNGAPLLVKTITTFNNHPQIDKIMVVTLSEYVEEIRLWIEKYHLKKIAYVIEGGLSRQESVFKALNALSTHIKDDDIVLIHDGARPLVTDDIISRNIEVACLHDACTTAIAVSDTIINSLDGYQINLTLNRSTLYALQTPQSFRYRVIMDAHLHALSSNNKDASDDTQLVLQNNGNVFLVTGDKINFKITTPEDLTLLKAILSIKK